MSRLNALMLLFCLPAISIALEARGDEPVTELIVRSGGEVRLLPPRSDLRVEAALDGGLLQPVDGPLTVPEGAGEHWLATISRDALGNVSPVRWLRIRLDDQPPEVELTVRPEPVVDAAGRPWVPSGATVTARADDALAGVAGTRLEVGEAVVEEDDGEVELELTGSVEVAVRASAVDRVEQRSDEAHRTLSIDATPPGGEILFDGPQTSTAASLLVIAPATRARAELRDAESGVAGWTALVDGEEVATTAWDGPWTAGRHRLSARVVDRVGNVGEVEPRELIVDADGPSVTWRLLNQGFADAGGETWYLAPMALELSVEDAVAGVESITASSDGQVFTPWSPERTVDAEHLIVRAVDRVGNQAEQEITWRLDREAPTVALRTADGRVRDPGSVLTLVLGEELHVASEDRGSGVERATYRLNRWPPRPLPEIIEFLDRGTFTLEIVAVDRVGHEHRETWTVAVVRAGKEDS